MANYLLWAGQQAKNEGILVKPQYMQSDFSPHLIKTALKFLWKLSSQNKYLIKYTT